MTPAKDNTVKTEIRDWWASHPMTYGHEHGELEYEQADGTREKVEIGSQRFFSLADEQFYIWNKPIHTEAGYFGALFPYEKYKGKKVLEIGCGMGCMSMNWAQHGAQVTAVDLNPVAVETTKRRFKAFGLKGKIQEADGESLPFEDNTFDYVYSWGVLHHSPHTRDSIAEVYRVLKPGGEAGIMLYHRNSFMFRYMTQYIEGFLHWESRFLDLVGLGSRYGDGERGDGNPHTWPVTVKEVHRDLMAQYQHVRTEILGTDVPGYLNHLFPRLGTGLLPQSWVNSLARRTGWTLWMTGQKPGAVSAE